MLLPQISYLRRNNGREIKVRGYLEIKVRGYFWSTKYIPSSAPLKVTVSTGSDAGKDEQTLELRSSQDSQVRVRCAELSKEVGVAALTRPAWSPYRASPGRSNDRRILGVEQVLD